MSQRRMRAQQFETPSEALSHYGVKGMRWGVRNEDKPTGRRSGSIPARLKDRNPADENFSEAEYKAAGKRMFSKLTEKQIQAEGKKKLAEQAASVFPEVKRRHQERRADKVSQLRERAAEATSNVEKLSAEKAALPRGVRSLRKHYNLQIQIDQQKQLEQKLLRDVADVEAGRLTTKQKRLVALGAVAAVGVAAAYGTHQYKLRQAGLTPRRKKQIESDNKRETADQWEAMFGERHDFETASHHLLVTDGSFYAGFRNDKAFSRPEFTISKDTVFQRLSNHQEDSSEYGKMKGTYATFLANDKKIYGASSEFGGSKYTLTFTSKKDVKVPNLTTVLAHLKQVKQQEDPSRSWSADDIVMEYKSMAGGNWAGTTGLKLFESLRTFGYGAIVDDMDAGYLGDLPVVFFGEANPARATERTSVDKLMDSIGVQKLTRKYA